MVMKISSSSSSNEAVLTFTPVSILLLLLFNFKTLHWVGLIVALSWGFYNLLRKKINVDTDVGLFIEGIF